ncbi:MAG TPA: type II secretion system F family protein [Candidatus Bilamarchaeaceae archaeon]|nr:type II secretion system F family protein [Candidatus Bilamarchaeaceae archaeon]
MAAPSYPRTRRGVLTHVAEALSPYFPTLKKRLLLAGIVKEPITFMEQVIGSSFFVTVALLILTGMFFYQNGISLLFLLPLALIYLLVVFEYLLLYPNAVVIRRRRELDYEVLFAGRHLLIALKSGMPLFDAMVGLTRGYGAVSEEFNKVVEKVSLGTPLSQAMREVAQSSPSTYFVRLIMQIANSLSSGANLADAIEVVTDQIAKEQMIQLKEYGQKLTPLVMFFMVLGIILPSIGVVILTVLFSFASGGLFGITPFILGLVFAAITIIQFLFLGIIETSRPKYLL